MKRGSNSVASEAAASSRYVDAYSLHIINMLLAGWSVRQIAYDEECWRSALLFDETAGLQFREERATAKAVAARVLASELLRKPDGQLALQVLRVRDVPSARGVGKDDTPTRNNRTNNRARRRPR